MGRKLRRLRELAPGELELLAEGWLWLLAAALLTRLESLGEARESLAQLAGSARRGLSPSETPDRLYELVAVAARHHLAPMRCLQRSLALEVMLRRRGVASELRIGVEREGDRLRAHAWLEHDGRPVGETGDVSLRFAPLG